MTVRVPNIIWERNYYPWRPGLDGWYTLRNPNFLAADEVVSPMHATEPPHFSGSGRRLTQALLQHTINNYNGLGWIKIRGMSKLKDNSVQHKQIYQENFSIQWNKDVTELQKVMRLQLQKQRVPAGEPFDQHVGQVPKHKVRLEL